jgi:hypothetical protein
VADDRSAPVRTADDLAGLKDLSRGSVGSLDPFVGTVHLPEGDYAVAVTSAGQLPTVLVPQEQVPWFPPDDPDEPWDPPLPTYAEVRLEPINSFIRIAEDRIGSWGGSTAAPPVVLELLDPTFDGRSVSPSNLWHVSGFEQFEPGHGITQAFDGSRNAQSGGNTFYFGNRTAPNYSIGGGVIPQGDLVSNPFSLKDYSPADKPVMYFNYRLDAAPGDLFRVFVQQPDGTNVLVASSSVAEYQSPRVQRLFNDDLWRQSRIALDAFARMEPLHILWEFSGSTATPGTQYRGVHIDDVIIGFAERGEMLTAAPSTSLDEAAATFTSSGFTPGIASGPYQLEMRKSTSYGTSVSGFFGQSALMLQNTFDTNDRFVQETTLIAPSGQDINDGDTFRLGDGANVVTFEYDSNSQVGSGNIPIRFTSASQDYQIAASIRDAINSPAVQAILRLQATLSDGTSSGTAGRTNKIVLFGNASGDIITGPSVQPSGQGIVGIQYEGFGDRNVFRDQGQTLIHSNTILYAADWGIMSDAGARDTQTTTPQYQTSIPARLGSPHMGPARNLRELNDAQTTGLQGGFAPGPVIVNNTIAATGVGGVYFSGDMAPYELTVRRGRYYDNIAAGLDPDDWVDLMNNTAGDAINDGDWFSLTVGRITVEFEFQDIANTGDDTGRKAHLGGATNPVGSPAVSPSTIDDPYRTFRAIRNWRWPGRSRTPLTTASWYTMAPPRWRAPSSPPAGRWEIPPSGHHSASLIPKATGPCTSKAPARWAFTGCMLTSEVFENWRVPPLAHGPQPFGRIVNNTIHGTDGNESSFAGDAMVEPNDTIFNAIDTRQGRAGSPEAYTPAAASATIPICSRCQRPTSTCTSSSWTWAIR